ncbi:hypothetical protein C3K47_14260 [Solitalea longa]|uniref:histidine kinase n=1 Tax=Solitalea longa TaxID=2079460 RepID=A0A2S4ZZ19_9SPHI|nr:histidine kinase [Solitalea longa]POY35556.1 hypothetical protein C3K47_14260 [Solitalea longa]
MTNFNCRKALFFILTLLLGCIAFASNAQAIELRKIKGLPTNEVYDLLVDKQGLLWIGHDYGLSSFNGKSFTHYSNNQQTALAVSDLTEDSEGRIWCHNFNGQIFYIEKGKMNLLWQFDYTKETSFPRMIIWKDLLLATSNRGLFAYDIKKKKAKYLLCPNKFGSITKVGNKILIAGGQYCYLYEGGNKLTRLNYCFNFNRDKFDLVTFNPDSSNDTIFAFINPKAICLRYKLLGNKLRLIDTTKANDFINTISFRNGEQWLNSKKSSRTLNRELKIDGYNLTDLVTDHEGNQWFSSLKEGLLVKYANEFKKIDPKIALEKGDFVRTIFNVSNKTLIGTHRGDFFVKDLTKHITTKVPLASGVGAVENIFQYDNSSVFVCSSIGLFLFNLNNCKVTQLSALGVIKDLAISKDFVLLATATSLNVSTPDILHRQDKYQCSILQKKLPNIKPIEFSDGFYSLIFKRCKAVSYASFNHKILCSFKDGVFEYDNNQLKKLTFKNTQINSNTFLSYPDKIFIGTFAQGLLIYNNAGIRPIKNNNLIFSGPILHLKQVNDKICLLSSNGIQVFDPEKESIVASYSLPDISPGNVLDIDEVKGNIWMTTTEGIFELPKSKQRKSHPNIKMEYAIVNGSDTVTTDSLYFHYTQSNIRFYYQTSAYSNSQSIHIGYRLIGANDSSWQYTSSIDQPISFISLKPGEYVMESKAVNTAENLESAVNRYSFLIEKPWWLKTPYLILEIGSTLLIILFLVRRYFLNRLKQQKLFFEKELAIQQERQRISADIHDELGASLSGIRIMAEMAKRKHEKEEVVATDLQNIHSNVSQLSQKMREVIWSLSSENDSLENLLGYIHRRAEELFANSPITFKSILPERVPQVILNGEKRRHIYLTIKEALHNVLKHSESPDVRLTINIIGNMLLISIQDNGIGFNNTESKDGNGLHNMQQRIITLGGKIKFKNQNGTTVLIEIPF